MIRTTDPERIIDGRSFEHCIRQLTKSPDRGRFVLVAWTKRLSNSSRKIRTGGASTSRLLSGTQGASNSSRKIRAAGVESSLPWEAALRNCVDQDIARLHASRLANQRLVPHLDVGASVSLDRSGQPMIAADVRFLLPRDGCVGCVGGLEQTERMKFLTRFPRGSIFPKREGVWHEARLGSLITNNAAAVSTGIQTWIQYLRAELSASIWHRIIWTAEGGISTETLRVHAAGNCVLCNRIG